MMAVRATGPAHRALGGQLLGGRALQPEGQQLRGVLAVWPEAGSTTSLLPLPLKSGDDSGANLWGIPGRRSSRSRAGACMTRLGA